MHVPCYPIIFKFGIYTNFCTLNSPLATWKVQWLWCHYRYGLCFEWVLTNVLVSNVYYIYIYFFLFYIPNVNLYLCYSSPYGLEVVARHVHHGQVDDGVEAAQPRCRPGRERSRRTWRRRGRCWRPGRRSGPGSFAGAAAGRLSGCD